MGQFKDSAKNYFISKQSACVCVCVCEASLLDFLIPQRDLKMNLKHVIFDNRRLK